MGVLFVQNILRMVSESVTYIPYIFKQTKCHKIEVTKGFEFMKSVYSHFNWFVLLFS